MWNIASRPMIPATRLPPGYAHRMRFRKWIGDDMNESDYDESPRGRKIEELDPSKRIALIAILLLVAGTQISCGSMWQRVREGERVVAVESARDYARNGKCAPALFSLDRAQATLKLGTYARKSTTMRARCYEKLGLTELASAHLRLLADFYDQKPIAVEGRDGQPVLRIADATQSSHVPPPSSLKIPRPRYEPSAQRSGIVGRVVISFDLARDGRPTNIRVLEMPHILLATWAIEAIAESELRKTKKPMIPLGEHYLTILNFEWRWAEESQAGQDS